MVDTTFSHGSRIAARGFLLPLAAITLLFLSACGGGGGSGGNNSGNNGNGGSTQPPPTPVPSPLISATLLSSSYYGPDLELIPGAGVTRLQVKVTDDGDVSVANATVTLNGTAFAYDATRQIYTGALTIQPGDAVSLLVTVRGINYPANARQFDTVPKIFTSPTVYSPAAAKIWAAQAANSITWSNVIPGQRSSYGVGIADIQSGALLWPAGGALQSVATSERSVTVPASALTAGERIIVVGIFDATAIVGAKAGSGMLVGRLSSMPLSVVDFHPSPSPAPPLTQSVGLRGDYAHTGRTTVANGQPVFPSTSAWVTTLNNGVSYPVIAAGKVFVLADGNLASGTGRSLYALDEANGNILWGPVRLPFGSYSHVAHAYDQGKVFVLDSDSRLSAYDAATGTELWSQTLMETGFFMAAPTAVNGVVYVGGSGALYAVDQRTGAILWRTYTPDGGTVTAPTFAADSLFITAPCHAYKVDPLTGNLLWKFLGPASGGGSGVPGVLANNRIYDMDPCMRSDGSNLSGRTFDAATGAQGSPFNADQLPAFSDRTGFFLTGGVLAARDQASGNTLWTFTGDGQLTTAPIVVDDFVIIASSSGKVYALNADPGTVAWSGMTASPIPYVGESGGATVLGGNAVGDGYLVVPAGNTLTSWRLLP